MAGPACGGCEQGNPACLTGGQSLAGGESHADRPATQHCATGIQTEGGGNE